MRISRDTIVRSALTVLALGGLLTTTACGASGTDKHTSKPSASATPQANTVVLKNNIDPCKLIDPKVLRASNNGKAVSIKHSETATSPDDLYRRRCEFTNGLIVSTLREPKGSKLVYNEYDRWHSGGEGIDFEIIDNSTLKQYPGADDGEWILDSHKPVALQVHTVNGVTLYFTSTQANKPAVVRQQFTAYAQVSLKNPLVVNPL